MYKFALLIITSDVIIFPFVCNVMLNCPACLSFTILSLAEAFQFQIIPPEVSPNSQFFYKMSFFHVSTLSTCYNTKDDVEILKNKNYFENIKKLAS